MLEGRPGRRPQTPKTRRVKLSVDGHQYDTCRLKATLPRTPSERYTLSSEEDARSMGERRNWPEMRSMPAYTVKEVALWLDVPKSTLQNWLNGHKHFEAVIDAAVRNPTGLSFVNLVEAHVLASIRRVHHVPLPKVRAAIRYVQEKLGIDRPLADQQFATDGVNLFIEHLGQLVNVSQHGQGMLREFVAAALSRVNRDPAGIPIRLYPFTRPSAGEVRADPMLIVIDPAISFGRPVLAGTGIPTAVLAERFSAGESPDDLAEDYGMTRDAVEEALRCELRFKQAA